MSRLASPSHSVPLERALAFRAPDVIRRFCDKMWRVELAEAEEIFTETKRWLWLSSHPAATDVQWAITPPLSIVDEMWHNFVLFTREYAAFCNDTFGRYLHHAPMGAGDTLVDPAAVADSLQSQYRAIAELSGMETLFKWYVDFPSRYDTRFFASRAVAPVVDWVPSPELMALRDVYEGAASE